MDNHISIGVVLDMGVHNVPSYATKESAGFDLSASQSIYIPPKSHALVHTGIHLDIPEGYHVEIRSRSGLASKKGVFVLNSPGTIDSDYTGEICVILCNLGDSVFNVSEGDRIAQAVLMKHEVADFIRVDSIVKNTDRGEGGFGSTGV